MNSFFKYFHSLFSGILTLLIGMKTSMKVFLRKKVTDKYPENRDTLKISDRFRGTLVMPHDSENHHKCVACGICQISCPNGSIVVHFDTVVSEDGKKSKVLTNYEYDLGNCMYCQLCVNTCPHDAICFDNSFEHAVFSREKLIKKLNREGSTLVKK